jgi:tRNA pseudouridine38-40 synthase
VKNFKLEIEYEGTDFHGWQIQPGVRTIQGTLEAALGDLFRQEVRVAGCCRTDAGVHATGFVCSFHVETGLDAARVLPAIAARMPDDIVLRGAWEMDADFHARHSALARRYVYKISTDRTALLRRVVAWTRFNLDVERMSMAARFLEGVHDFSSFAPAALGEDVSPVCDVHWMRVEREGAVVQIDIKADRFVHHMVRNIAGTLIEVGRGRFDPEHAGEVLRKKDRRAAGPTAPACGLCLARVYYAE